MRAPATYDSDSLRAAWNSPRVPLFAWVRNVEGAYNESGLDVLDAAESIGATAAELEAVIRLSLLDDPTLGLISNQNPPMTTWLLLSELASDDIPKVLEALGSVEEAQSDYQRMEKAVREVTGRAAESAVQTLDPALFDFASRKAQAYSVWPPDRKHYRALRNFASRRRSGRPLTSRQTAYAKGLLVEIIDSGAIRVPSPDGDDDQCESVIKAVS